MIVDTSALVAIMRAESGHERIVAALLQEASWEISAASYVELSSVMGRTPERQLVVDKTLVVFRVEIAPFDEAQARLAAAAYQRYGRGSGHPARLNMGDVYSYALARARDEPLLFVGDDFARTDVTPALPSAA